MKKDNLKKLVLATIAMGTMWSVPFVVSAEETDVQEFALDEVVVTANRMENKLVDTPANVSVVTAEEMERKNIQNAIEAVKNVPGVTVLSGARNDESYISINGDVRVLILVDGRRINSDKGVSSGRANVDADALPPVDAIERIEIVKNGGATVYGTDGAAGVINIITKSAKKNYVKASVSAGSWGNQNYHMSASAKEGKTGVFATFSKEKQSYYKYKEANSSHNVREPNSFSDNIGATIKLEQEIGNDQLATLYFEHSMKKGGRPNGAYGSGGVSSWSGKFEPSWDEAAKGSELNNNISLKYDWNTQSDNKGYIQVYKNYNAGNYYGSYVSKYSDDKVGVDIQQNIKTSDTNNIVVGGSYYDSKIENQGNYDSKRSLNDKALFVQDAWNFLPTWTLNAGVRYDNHSYAGSKTTASVAVNKKFTEGSHAYVSWSQIFNAPKGNDLFWYEDWGYGMGMFGNPNLKPETGDIWSIGYDTNVGRKGQAGINLFYSELDDAINWDSDEYGSVWTPENVDKQKRRGLEVNYKHQFDDNWSANASYAYVKVENKYGNAEYARDLNQVPNQYKFGVAYNKDKWNVDLFARGGSGASVAKYADSNYLTMDLNVNYMPQKNWKVFAKAYNLTNASYAEKGGVSKYMGYYHNINNYPAAGRRFLVGTEVTF